MFEAMIEFSSSPATAAVLGWALTYLVHSTVLIGVAWGLGRILQNRRLVVQDLMWKGALVGGVVTATLQALLVSGPLFQVGASIVEPTAAVPMVAAQPALMPILAETPAVYTAAAEAVPMLAAVPPVPAQAPPSDPLIVPLGLFVGLWGVVAGLLLGRLFLSWRQLQELVSDREWVADAELRSRFRALRSRAGVGRGVRLTTSHRVPVPIALGVWRREVCVPARLVDLSKPHQTAVLAHELAHASRWDPLWLLVGRTVRAVLFFQPLNALVTWRMGELSEYLADDRAVTWTRNQRDLAESLAEVASWVVHRDDALPVPAMAAAPSVLRDRVRRLVTGVVGGEGGLPLRRVLPAAALVVGGLAIVLPRVSFAQDAEGAAGDAPTVHATADDGRTVVIIEGEGGEEPTVVRVETSRSNDKARRKAERKERKRRRKRSKKGEKDQGSEDTVRVVVDGEEIRVQPGDVVVHESRDRGGKTKVKVKHKHRRKNREKHGSNGNCQTWSEQGVSVRVCEHGDVLTVEGGGHMLRLDAEAFGEQMERMGEQIERQVEQQMRQVERQMQQLEAMQNDPKARAEMERMAREMERQQQRAGRQLEREIEREVERELRRWGVQMERHAEQARRQAQRQDRDAREARRDAETRARNARRAAEQAQRDAERARRQAEQALREAERARREAERLRARGGKSGGPV